MTKEQLESIAYLDSEIRMWERELVRIRASFGNSAVKLSDMPKGNAVDGTERIIEAIDLERKILKNIEQVTLMKYEIMSFIRQIEDSLIRQIVGMRCIELKSWRMIAAEVGGYNTADSVRMLYNRFCEKNLEN